MLEFQGGFFEQEIREGFYLDTTMKTVWAAEMEVLQKVAEVCDKYGLTWYAAYGTLMGAIRHEGFVPWDDDMDIWLLREDYNKLMKVLPKELPEGYRVRSSLTDEGYVQFHTCVTNGSEISIKEEWLEQFHGCPFIVGIDIFPLDYLPRNEKDRMLQKELFLLIAQVARLARAMAEGEYDVKEGENEEAVQKRKKKVKQEIQKGIVYLEKNYKLSVNQQLLEEEQWHALSSELWKWGNHIAMMYHEEESDYLVYYLDYSKWEEKILRKEWFGEVYGATFENFMLLVPAGYDQILKKIYGDYWIPIKKAGMHDYPCYIKQLRQLKEFAKRAEEKTGSINAEMLPIVLKEDGSRKKLILSANDPAIYADDGDRALDKLEETFKVFKTKRDDFTLWWRPHSAMKKVLNQTSPELGERYQQILDRYKSEGWGICDETDKTECAVENCDAYYGDMNAIIQPFQNADKPIMIAQIDKGAAYHDTSADRYSDEHIFLSGADFVTDEKKLYFSNRTCNALVIVDRETWAVESMVPFAKKELKAKELHVKCHRQGNKIYFLPQGDNMIHVYDMESGEQKTYELEGGFGTIQNIAWNYHIWQNKIYLLPCGGGIGLWSFDAEGQLNKEKWWEAPFDGNYFLHGSMDEQHFFSLEAKTRCLTITNLENSKTRTYRLPDKRVHRITYDGQDFWYVSYDNADIVRWNPAQGESARYHFLMWDKCHPMGMPYVGIHAEGQDIFIVSGNGEGLFVLDKEKGELKKVFEMPDLSKIFRVAEKEPFFTRIGDKLLWTFQSVNAAVEIDLNTLEGKLCKDVITFNEKVQDYLNRVLIQNAPLFIEDSDWNLENYLYYCENSIYEGF